MISFTEFVNKVENAKPPILKEYKKKIRLTNLQGIGLCLLIFFSLFIPFILWTSYKEYGKLMDDTVFVAILSLIALGITWAFFIYSLKHFTLKEKRKIYNPSSPVKFWDILVVILAICIFLFGCTGILPDFASIAIALLSILGAIGYFLSPWREKQIDRKIPLFRLLSILGWERKIHEKQHPFFFSKHGKNFGYLVRVPRFFSFDINGTPVYIGRIQFFETHTRGANILELDTITFNIPDYNQDSDALIKNLSKFISTRTGRDLFFIQSAPKHFLERENGRLEISFPAEGDIEDILFLSDTEQNESRIYKFGSYRDFYLDKYFHYTREDLDTIYKDVQTLLNAIDSRY